MKPDEFLEFLWTERASAILRTQPQRRAADAMDAAARGGFRILEFTLSVPGVYELIEEFSSRDGVVVGAGTVLHADQVEKVVAAGGRFIVSPATDERVIDACRSAGVVAMPGGFTATEMYTAYRAGAQLQKLFPTPGIGSAYVRMLMGPLPMLRVVPTSGVDADNVADWFAAGVYGVGFVASLFTAEDLANDRFDAIEERARACSAAAHAAERPPRPQVPEELLAVESLKMTG